MRDYLWCMSLLEWLKIWCKFYRIPLFCNTEYPPPPRKLKFRQILGHFQLQNTPPPENWNLGRSWDFEYFQLQNTPPPLLPPRKLKFRQILGLWVFSVTEYPPPKKNWNLGRSWDFEYFQLQNTPPPPPENWNLDRSWDFEYFQLQNTPPIEI